MNWIGVINWLSYVFPISFVDNFCFVSCFVSVVCFLLLLLLFWSTFVASDAFLLLLLLRMQTTKGNLKSKRRNGKCELAFARLWFIFYLIWFYLIFDAIVQCASVKGNADIRRVFLISLCALEICPITHIHTQTTLMVKCCYIFTFLFCFVYHETNTIANEIGNTTFVYHHELEHIYIAFVFQKKKLYCKFIASENSDNLIIIIISFFSLAGRFIACSTPNIALCTLFGQMTIKRVWRSEGNEENEKKWRD